MGIKYGVGETNILIVNDDKAVDDDLKGGCSWMVCILASLHLFSSCDSLCHSAMFDTSTRR